MYVNIQNKIVIETADPIDRRLIRFNNCLQMAACLCNILGCPGSDIVDCIADLVTACLMGCMTAQLNIETKAMGKGGKVAPIGAPSEVEMKR